MRGCGRKLTSYRPSDEGLGLRVPRKVCHGRNVLYLPSPPQRELVWFHVGLGTEVAPVLLVHWPNLDLNLLNTCKMTIMKHDGLEPQKYEHIGYS